MKAATLGKIATVKVHVNGKINPDSFALRVSSEESFASLFEILNYRIYSQEIGAISKVGPVQM